MMNFRIVNRYTSKNQQTKHEGLVESYVPSKRKFKKSIKQNF